MNFTFQSGSSNNPTDQNYTLSTFPGFHSISIPIQVDGFTTIVKRQLRGIFNFQFFFYRLDILILFQNKFLFKTKKIHMVLLCPKKLLSFVGITFSKIYNVDLFSTSPALFIKKTFVIFLMI